MGVLGLYPFLRKAFPDVVKQLPHRLRDLAGQRIVIDGTLITQRLHFAPVPHGHRHVLGWYKLVKEMQDSGVTAICVFDGFERSLAKARETERRREARKLTIARASIESDRMQRLQQLALLVNDVQSVSAKGQLSELFLQISEEQASYSPKRVVHKPPEEELVHIHDIPEREMDEYSLDYLDTLQADDISYLSPTNDLDDYTATTHVSPESTLYSHVSLAELPGVLNSLYSQFRGSVSKLASLSPSASEEHIEYSMSKTQQQLAADEAKFWAALASDSLTGSLSDTLSTLTLRAELISESYQRRTNPPTTRTYDESKELLRAMGIPCIDSTGTYEAEALAASMVQQGLADYVASEDTDVVIYEAPLVRNLTSRNLPLTLLSGKELRTTLELDRASFIDFALLLGTDFTQRIKNVGPTRALKFIREHKSIERVLDVEIKYPPRSPPAAYLADVESARLVFETLPPVPDAGLLDQKKDLDRLSTVLQRCGLGRLLLNEEWNYEDALEGNYFADDPSAY
ncbi:hypothetical protein MIND_00160200 [Mycena indigotica]|uniref:PIN domain-like protein n=1 Tax=Mycena indigotica TaxID=2126181 RepID=A0A8H6TFQ1_9AGAR|nr:uncharacterized protein MIND_00160200 [Mycena indigotica]KAF7316414.1 hypothetical protein MIND_00160200 [Mycena indigotica]